MPAQSRLHLVADGNTGVLPLLLRSSGSFRMSRNGRAVRVAAEDPDSGSGHALSLDRLSAWNFMVLSRPALET